MSWRQGYRGTDRGRRRPPPAEATGEEAAEDVETTPVVLWIPIQCPRCKSRNLKNNRTEGRVRYHVCQECGLRFKSLETYWHQTDGHEGEVRS